MIARGERMNFLKPTPYRVQQWLLWRADAQARRFNPFQPLDATQALLRCDREFVQLYDVNDGVVWSRFVEDSEQRLVGRISMSNYNSQMLTAEIGYQVAPEAQGRGYGTAMVRRLVEEVRSETKLRKLYAMVHHDNVASRRLLEKNGFQLEGILRQHYLIAGVPADECFYGLLL